MKQETVLALVEAHYARDEERFRRLTLQAAAHAKSETIAARLKRHTEAAPLVALATKQATFAQPLVPVERDALVLPAALVVELDAIIAEHAQAIALFAHGLRPRRRLLFSGPPGNGKTSTAGWLAKAVSVNAYAVFVPGLVKSFMGETSANLATLFPALKSGVALVFDEMDGIGSSREVGGAPGTREYNLVVNTLLALLDATEGGLFIATTNRADILDTALLRRFDAVLEFPEPCLRDKAELWRRLAKRHALLEGPIEIDLVRYRSFDAVAQAYYREARRAVLAGGAANRESA